MIAFARRSVSGRSTLTTDEYAVFKARETGLCLSDITEYLLRRRSSWSLQMGATQLARRQLAGRDPGSDSVVISQHHHISPISPHRNAGFCGLTPGINLPHSLFAAIPRGQEAGYRRHSTVYIG